MAFYLFRKGIRKLPGDVIKAVTIPEPEVIQGFGSRGQVGEICKKAGFQSVLLVTDATLFELGFYKKVQGSLRAQGIACSVFADICSEPTVDVIEKGKRQALACEADCIVALGGGSVLDSSKIIAASARHPQWHITHYLKKFALVTKKTLPLITIPSTAGTGAEHTVGAVVKNARGVKTSTVVVGLDVPNVILDSELTVGAPQSVTVWCGIDALSHGLEGLLADVDSSAEDIEKSRECVRLVFENLAVLLKEPRNIEARQKMSLAAFYGGNAINRQLAGYVHAFAHSIGGIYHIPHGEAIAYCLVPVVRAQRGVCAEKLAALSVFCGFADEHDSHPAAIDRLITALRQLLRHCGLPKGCAALREQDYKKLTRLINFDSINYSPSKTFTDEEIHRLLEQIAKGD